MAQRRMFSLSVVDTDIFLDLPLSSQALYFHLGMRADDDGFLGNAKTIQRTVGASADDLKLLIAKGLLIEFASGVCVIRDWDTNNYIRNDRYHETRYLTEKSMLSRVNGYYALSDGTKPERSVTPMDTICIPPVNQSVYQNADSVYQRYTAGIPTGSGTVTDMDTEVRLGKERLGEDSLGEDTVSPPVSPHGGACESVPVSDSEKPKKQSKPKKPKEPKVSYAEFVTMTETEHQKLIDQYGEAKTARMIEILNNYKGSTGKRYASDYMTCLNWVAKRADEDMQRNAYQNNAYQGGGYGQGNGYGQGGEYYANPNGTCFDNGSNAFYGTSGSNAGSGTQPPERRWPNFTNW